MDRQGGAARQVDHDQLGAPSDRLRPSARRRRRRTRRVLGSQRARPGAACPDDRRSDEPRPQVARDGLDLGQLRHRRSGCLQRLVGLGRDRVGAGQRGHRLPVVADLDVDGERHVERQRRLHRRAEDRDEPVDLVAGHLEQQLVVDLEQRPGAEAAGASRSARRIIAILMMSAAVPWIGMLIAIRSPAARRLGLRACELRDLPLAAEERRDEALLPGRFLDVEHVVADARNRSRSRC